MTKKYGDWKCDTVEIRVRDGEIIFYQGEDMIVIENRIWDAIVKDFGNQTKVIKDKPGTGE